MCWIVPLTGGTLTLTWTRALSGEPAPSLPHCSWSSILTSSTKPLRPPSSFLVCFFNLFSVGWSVLPRRGERCLFLPDGRHTHILTHTHTHTQSELGFSAPPSDFSEQRHDVCNVFVLLSRNKFGSMCERALSVFISDGVGRASSRTEKESRSQLPPSAPPPLHPQNMLKI